MVKCEERPLEGEVCEIPVRPPMNDGAMETVECIWVDIWCMLDQVIGLCHKMAEMHFPGMGCSMSETLVADGDGVCENGTHYEAEHQKAQHGETGACALKAKPKMDANKVVKESKFE